LGTSRAKHQIDPDKLLNLKGKGYNAGIDKVGKSFYNGVLLDIILNNKIKPRTILLQLDASDFYNNIDNRANELVFLYPYYNQSKLLQEYIKMMGYSERLKTSFNMYEYNGKIFNLLYNYTKRNSVTDNNGFAPVFGILDTVKNSVFTETVNQHPDLSALKLSALHNIILLCEANRIKLIFLICPSYNNFLFDRASTENFKKYVITMTNSKLIDMADVNKFNELKGIQNWKDFLHLNNIGAAKFSQYLNDSLR
jgi:hypothetical protein